MRVLINMVGVVFVSLLLNSCMEVKDSGQHVNESLIKSKADSVLKLMTLDEKIGQLVLLTADFDITGPPNDNMMIGAKIREEYLKDIREGKVGGIFNAFTAEFIRKVQQIAVNETRLKIPLLFGYDVIHGYKTIFPVPLAEASSWDIWAIEKSARIAATEASADGINWTFAPVADISHDPRWGRIVETVGEDPYLGSMITRARVRGFQGKDLSSQNSILCCIKHFAAYGNPIAGKDYNSVDMSERMLRSWYFPPYYAGVQEGAATIMSAFHELNGVPCTSNDFLLIRVLRKEWGFKGFVVSDYAAVNELIKHGLASNQSEAAELAIKAGLDMDMESSAYETNLKLLVENGKVSKGRIDEAARLILEMKFRLGLFTNPYKYCNEAGRDTILYHPSHINAALEMAKKSIVLLKNKDHVLPIDKNIKRIAIVGPLADSKIDLLGSWKAAGEPAKVKTILESLKDVARENGITISFAKGCGIMDKDPSGIEEAKRLAKKSDMVVLVVGESYKMTEESACRSDINLPGIQTELIRAVKSTGTPMVLVLLNGRPLSIVEEDEMANGILEAWYPGLMGGEAIAETLFGLNNPSAKLPVSFPRNVGQIPVYYSYKNTGRPAIPYGEVYTDFLNKSKEFESKYIDISNEPLYPFGYGLSYSTFAYGQPVINKSEINNSDTLVAEIVISNIGNRDGEEIVQLYIGDNVASVTRPVKELKGFEKVFIEAGKSKHVKFKITKEELSFFRKDMSWGPENGEYKVMIGPNSRDVYTVSFILKDKDNVMSSSSSL